MSKVWLNIIGMGEGQIDEISLPAKVILADAKYVLGAKRLLDRVPHNEGQRLVEWQTPYKAMVEQIIDLRGEDVVILASGDANWFGIGASLLSQFSPEEFNSFPAVSSLQLAAAKMHWAMQNIDCISLHGRAVDNLHYYVQPRNRILALTSNANTLVEVAALLKQRGYEKSILSVLENLGAKNERIVSFIAKEAAAQKIDGFYVLAIDCIADIDAPILPRIAGLLDDVFCSDGQLTKREVRAISLAKLAPFPNALLWDIGAGCGSVAIEFMRAARSAKAICFERDEKRISLIEKNKIALGVPALKIIAGDALANIKNQPTPDAVFLGGGVANEKLFEACYKALKIGGRMVVNAVTIEGEKALFERHEKLGGELVKIAISTLKQTENYRMFDPKKIITQWVIVKGQN